jgi:hypothetical protein
MKKRIDAVEALGRKLGEWSWCLHCERVYQVGEFRREGDLQMCPYPECDGDTVMDNWRWPDIRENHPEYPEVPERGKVYPLN